MKIDVSNLSGGEQEIQVRLISTVNTEPETDATQEQEDPNNSEVNEAPKEKNAKKNKSNRRILGVVIICSSIILVAISTFMILNWYVDNSRINELQNEFTGVEEVDGGDNVNPPDDESDDYWDFVKMSLINVNFDELLKRNSDTVGWINIPATNINYPVVQTNNNEYYLTHAFDNSKNSAGWIFTDYRNNMTDFDNNTIIYGHSRFDGTMFGTLKNALSQNWYNDKNNHVIRLSTPSQNTMWQVFSVYQTPTNFDYLKTTFASDSSYKAYLNEVSNRSVHSFTTRPNTNDKIITISTCANNIQDDRIVLHARLIKQQNR